MALGRQMERQSELLLSWSELPRSQGHPFDDRLQEILRGAGFDRHVETLCRPHYSSVARGRKVKSENCWKFGFEGSRLSGFPRGRFRPCNRGRAPCAGRPTAAARRS